MTARASRRACARTLPATGVLRLSYAAKLVLAAVEARGVETAVDMFLGVKGAFDFANLLAYPLYRYETNVHRLRNVFRFGCLHSPVVS